MGISNETKGVVLSLADGVVLPFITYPLSALSIRKHVARYSKCKDIIKEESIWSWNGLRRVYRGFWMHLVYIHGRPVVYNFLKEVHYVIQQKEKIIDFIDRSSSYFGKYLWSDARSMHMRSMTLTRQLSVPATLSPLTAFNDNKDEAEEDSNSYTYILKDTILEILSELVMYPCRVISLRQQACLTVTPYGAASMYRDSNKWNSMQRWGGSWLYNGVEWKLAGIMLTGLGQMLALSSAEMTGGKGVLDKQLMHHLTGYLCIPMDEMAMVQSVQSDMPGLIPVTIPKIMLLKRAFGKRFLLTSTLFTSLTLYMLNCSPWNIKALCEDAMESIRGQKEEYTDDSASKKPK